MKKGGIAAVVVIILAIVIGLVYWQTRSASPTSAEAPAPTSNAPSETPAPESTQPNRAAPKENEKRQPSSQPSRPQSPTAQYCDNKAAQGNVRAADTKALAAQGGLVAILSNEAALHDAYACADTYLKTGGDIDAADPRADSDHLTPLLFAIQRNDPKMVRYLLEHGADPSTRGGPKHIKPYGYAVYLALKNQATNYNEVISILDSALEKTSSGQKAG
ncbi:ankyrin repeat domain-containing protein [Salinisphaera sp. Q1T1-3]|uniref:ankyrin repeat domain-containing protein n=1 Tax=Salinisphaera sp. Q1T1-3 TaxID=2321229 RepID=UPI0018F2E79C|nr:ankyrin repeat domain-containing protein [Salinisphaera sp. Q1T1-3]